MAISAEALPPPPDRAPDLDDDLTSGPSPRRWVDHYLPHRTVPERQAPAYGCSSWST